MLTWLLKKFGAAPTPAPPSAPTPASASAPAPAGGSMVDVVAAALAGTALEEGQGRLAEECLAALRARHGADPGEAAWRGFLGELRRAKAVQAGFAAGEALAAALPGQAWPLQELLGFCTQGTDTLTALSVGERLHAILPTAPGAINLVLHALRKLGRAEAARAFFDSLPAEVRGLDWYLVLALREAWTRQDWAWVEDLGAQLRAVAPERAIGYTLPSAALREQGRAEDADAVIRAGLVAVAGAPEVWREAALVAQALEDTPLAYARWEALHRRFPANTAGIMGAIALSQRLGQKAETARLTAEGLACFPSDRGLLVLAATLATEAGDMEVALARWRQAIAADPQDPSLWLRAAHALLGGGAGRHRRRPAALAILAELNEVHADHVPGCLMHLKLLRDAGRFDEADALCAAWRARFPDDHALAVAQARISENRGDVAASLACLREVRARTGASAALEAAFARTLSLAGEDEAADEACEAGLRAFPDDVGLLGAYSTLAMRRGDWRVALARAQAGLALRPNAGLLQGLLQRARVQIVPEAGEGPAGGTPESVEPSFFLRFESLGATAAGCEFGIVQRRFGCEPLGLLRWARIDIAGLTQALADGFEGMGAPENTQLLIRDEGPDHQEYYVEDSRMGYSTHTFVTVQDVPFDRMMKQSQRRLAFLRGKLLEDLRAGEKIFVFKAGRTQATHEALLALFSALRGWSEATLLCVTLANATHPRGTLEMLRPGLFLGYAGSFMGVGRAGAAGIDTDQWRLFCERVAGWHDGDRKNGLF